MILIKFKKTYNQNDINIIIIQIFLSDSPSMLYCVSMDVSIGVSMVVFEASDEASGEACLCLRYELFGQQNRASKSVQKVPLKTF